MRFFSVLLTAVILSLTLTSQSAEVPPENQELPQQKHDKTLLDSSSEMAKDAAEQLMKTFGETRARRAAASYFVLANYSPLDLLIPSKLGLTLGLIRDADKSQELEYLQGSVSVPFCRRGSRENE